MKLPKSFYTQNVLELAPQLLGKTFVRKEDNHILSGKIVEVEAYDGNIDAAAHSFGGMTKRTEVMFREGGYLYVYFTYGAHFCCNIVAGREGHGTGVLIRGIEPVSGIELMIKNRFNGKAEYKLTNLTSGPGKVTQAFNIKGEDNGTDLTGDYIYLLDSPELSKDEIVKTTRVGISKAIDLPWRFYIKNNPYISKK